MSQNDDYGGTFDSRIEKALVAGAYTIEATTYYGDTTGSFTLTAAVVLPPTLAITTDEPFPDKGDAVTLTAEVSNPPEGQALSYQWAQKTGTSWNDLNGKTAATLSVTSSTPDAQTYRVAVKYGSTSISAAISVVWDEAQMLADLTQELTRITVPQSTPDSDGVQGTATVRYRGADAFSLEKQRFETCAGMSLAAALAAYSGITKDKVDKCDTDHGTFDDIQDAFESRLEQIAEGTTPLSRLLDTPQGEMLESTIADPDTIRFFATLLAPEEGSVSGQNGEYHRPTGLDCLGTTPTSHDVATDDQKYVVLNCLAFTTPHKFWVDLEEDEGDSRKKFMAAFCNDENPVWGKDCTDRKYDWIHYGNLECSSPVAPRSAALPLLTVVSVLTSVFKESLELAPCLKHDLTWNALQGFVDGNTTTQQEKDGVTKDDDVQDAAWSPRNKLLSDLVFLADHLCEKRIGAERQDCMDSDRGLFATYSNFGYYQARIAAWGVNDWSDLNWPITMADEEHAKARLRYMPCDIPRVDATFTLSSDRRSYTGKGQLQKGCVDDIEIAEYHWQPVKRSWFSLNPSVSFDPANFSVPAGNAKDGIRVTLTPENEVILGGARYLYIQQLTAG